MFARFVVAAALLTLAAAPEQTPVEPAPQVAVSADPRPRSPRSASYAIEARLDPVTRRVAGTQLLTWRNTSGKPTSTLQFHLYYNAWRNTSSTWMREQRLAGDTTLYARPEADWGWIDVEAVRITHAAGESDATAAMRFIAPDDGNPHDRTVLEVPLDRPVDPGETISVRMTWSSRVPRTFARTGVIGSYYFLAQWFPKIGVLQDTGWNCHQFHAATEFFSEFGTYDVGLTVPRGWTVGATGVERERLDRQDGTTTHRYYQEDVHDFAWTTSPDYVDVTETFTHDTLPAVRMRLLLQPEHRGQEARLFEATRAALKYYGEWYGPYPYGHVTIIDPAWRSGAGGMEYPTLFTAGTRWIAPRHTTQPESVTIHEAGHQFWYGIVATNEFEHAWLDEGLNTFSTTRVLAQSGEPNYVVHRYFGGFVPWIFPDLPIRREVESRSLVRYREAARGDVQALPTWKYWPGTASGTTYHKTALWLHTLERMLGWQTLQRILSTYFTRWAFRHPAPEDFFAIVNEVSGQDLTWFFDQVHRSATVFDYGVDLFRSEPAAERGYVGDRSSGRSFASSPVRSFGRSPVRSFTGSPVRSFTGSPVRSFARSLVRPFGGSPDDSRSGTSYRTTVVARRHGEGTFPVDVRVLFENNEEVRWRWDGHERWKLFEIEKPARARRADIDPERVLMLDINTTNNSALLEPAAPRAATKWSVAWLIWLQDHLLTYGFFI